jgi:hypothetical protein
MQTAAALRAVLVNGQAGIRVSFRLIEQNNHQIRTHAIFVHVAARTHRIQGRHRQADRDLTFWISS